MNRPSPRATPEDPSPDSGRARRILFLDDDPARAEVFLAANPAAIWVQTAADCIARLAEDWDEIHLDHDLGGERFVDLDRDDCGMAVVRWLCLQPHAHLKDTRFQVHSHNAVAAGLMAVQIRTAGFHVEARPFGSTRTLSLPGDPFWNRRPFWAERLAKLRDGALRLLGRGPTEGPGPARPPGVAGPPAGRRH